MELERLSDVWWASREKALNFLKFLNTLIKQNPPNAAVSGETKILLHSINLDFLLCLEMSTSVFLETFKRKTWELQMT